MAGGDQNPGANSFVSLRRDPDIVITTVLLTVVAIIAWVVTVRQMTTMQAMSMTMAEPAAAMQGMDMAGTEMPDMGMSDTDMSDTDTSETGMQGMNMPAMSQPAAALPGITLIAWSDAMAFLVAWGVMMAAMMLPSATPMIAFYGAARRNSSRTGEKGIPTTLFALIYLGLWLLFGIPVYLASRLLEAAAASSVTIAVAMPYLLGLTLVLAGAFQFTRLKEVCLHVCQHPMIFLMAHWRSGYTGTLRMALQHANFCIGCCWALMVVMVALGAMALHWMLLFSVIIAAEKLIPKGRLVARIFGGALVAVGLIVLIQPSLATMLRGMGM